ncbi:MAG: glycosyltransferase [Aquisalinus sp.]|nr:glycosyltransferase [Aquisalinus sp.]
MDIDSWFARLINDKPIWGPGFPGWNDSLDAEANLRSRYPTGADFDAIFLSHVFTTNHAGGRLSPPKLNWLGGIPTVSFQHEVRAVEQYDTQKRGFTCSVGEVDVVLYPYNEAEIDPFEADRELARIRAPRSRHAHQIFRRIPHHVRTDIFRPPSGGNAVRDLDVVLVGRAHESLYPLRYRWSRLIAEKRWHNAVHVPTLYGQQATWTATERQAEVERYIGFLQRAKIVVSCTSHWRYMLAKFNEIAACGAFIISDVATHMPQTFIDNIGIVSSHMRDTELVEVVNGWLAADEERERRTEILSNYVRANNDVSCFWDQVDRAVLDWRKEWLTSGAS